MVASTRNVGDVERLISILAGATLAKRGLKHTSIFGRALLGVGGALAYRGITGHCPAYRAMGRSTADRLSLPQRYTVRHALAINLPPRETLDNARQNMARLLSTAAPVAVTHDVKNEDANSFSWQCHSPDGLDLDGDVRALPDNKGSRSILVVTLNVDLGRSLAGKPKHLVSKPLAQHYLGESLRRFKMWLEAGEVATTEGQSHGRRSKAGDTFLTALRTWQHISGLGLEIKDDGHTEEAEESEEMLEATMDLTASKAASTKAQETQETTP